MVIYVGPGTYALDFVPDGALSLGYVNDSIAIHWIDKVKGFDRKQYGYNGDNGQPTWVVMNNKTITVSGTYNLIYKY